MVQVDLERALEPSRPVGARRPVVRLMRLVSVRFRSGSTIDILTGSQQLVARLGVGCQHGVEANQVPPRALNPGSRPLSVSSPIGLARAAWRARPMHETRRMPFETRPSSQTVQHGRACR
jgi:hypothetical protein